MCSPRSTHAIALGLVLAALAPATALASNDLRSPDGDAVIGTGGAVAVLALSAGGALAVQRRRHVASARTPAAA
jgi:hypothetical protein